CKDIDECVRIANDYAPEHLEVVISNPDKITDELVNYGSLFIGEYSAEVFGDYTAGVNHTLPTGGAAKYRGGLSVFDFLKITTHLKMTKEGLSSLGEATMRIADTEGLSGHYNAVRVRDV
ncbi:MAG: histidinol dehydrogenase, partial [Deltaproteobacteria bacterium]|nr:histidinol dehydrogenase [Deltaproteobacteria bacterium]